ncbi:MAG TPA: hypothetical protein PK787_04220 [Burkholderiaceae bacterium]|jgi:uncharacterized protein YfcZ (UPF0381/DUF406 family)|nr:hypothetical protein [Burkholderiaceae bacterium]
MIKRTLSMTVIASALAVPVVGMAADAARDTSARSEQRAGVAPVSTAGASTRDDARRFSDRDWQKNWAADKDKMEQALGVGKDKAHYRKALEQMGYHITAVNYDKPDYLEYEIVKGKDSYEVQVDFDKNTGKSTELDVTTNVWQADATDKALKDRNYKYTYPTAQTRDAERVSDRARLKAASANSDKLEKELGVGRDKAHYRSTLDKLGYKVTSVNYDKPDYVEYEVVKGEDSYEVQVDFDEKSKKSTKVDVTVNAVRADSTLRAMNRN